MFDINKYIEAMHNLDFVYTKVKTGWQWQCQMWDGDVKLVFVPDRISVQQGAVTDRARSWWCLTTRIILASKDEKFYMIGVQLLSPADYVGLLFDYF